jgi:hypothetical protein
VEDELERMWETAYGLIEILKWNLPRGNQNSHGKLPSRKPPVFGVNDVKFTTRMLVI